MIDKSVSTLSEAIAGIHDGATIMIGGFGPAGQPTFLIDALIDQGDRWGNLVYRKAARNFGPIMATAAKTTIVEVSQLVALGDLDPENIITPGIFVQRVFSLENLTAAQRA